MYIYIYIQINLPLSLSLSLFIYIYIYPYAYIITKMKYYSTNLPLSLHIYIYVRGAQNLLHGLWTSRKFAHTNAILNYNTRSTTLVTRFLCLATYRTRIWAHLSCTAAHKLCAAYSAGMYRPYMDHAKGI